MFESRLQSLRQVTRPVHVWSVLALTTVLISLSLQFFSIPVQAATGDVHITGLDRSLASSIIQEDNELSALPTFIKIVGTSGSIDSKIALTEGGDVYVWGADALKGDGTFDTAGSTPTKVNSLSNIEDVYVTSETFGAVTNGQIYTWGTSFNGLLGNSGEFQYLEPTQIAGIGGMTQVDAGPTFVIARKSDDTVWTWGQNGSGQLGLGDNTAYDTPQEVPGLGNISTVEASFGNGGTDFAFALTLSGTLYAWGNNINGQLGLGDTDNRNTPTLISGLSDVVSFSGGQDYAIAKTGSNTLYAWGNNSSGQFGDGTSTSSDTPTLITEAGSVEIAVSGGDHTVIKKTDGTVLSSGSNAFGQFGYGISESLSTEFVELQGFTNPDNIFAVGSAFYLIEGTTSTINQPDVASNEGMVLTVRNSGSYSPYPTTSNFVLIDSLSQQFIAKKSDGTLWTWSGSDEPQQVAGSYSDVTQITIGEGPYYTILRSDGSVWSWGYDIDGRTGLGEANVGTTISTPTEVSGISNAAYVASGATYTSAVTTSGALYAWGTNTYERMGYSNAGLPGSCNTLVGNPYCPTPIANPNYTSGVSKVAVGNSSNYDSNDGGSLLLMTDGTLEVTGDDQIAFWDLSSLTNITDIAIDRTQGVSGIALKSDGTVWTWGNNDQDQLGRSTAPDSEDNTPNQLTELSNIVKVAMSTNHGAALTSTGEVWSWGQSITGTGDRYGTPVPKRVLGIVAASDISRNPAGIISGEVNGGFGSNATAFCSTGGSLGDTTLSNVTILCMTANAGTLNLYAGDSQDDNDVCTPADNTNSTTVDTTTSNQSSSSVVCEPAQSASSLTSVNVANVRQNSTSTINDIVFEDLRGLPTGTYSLAATISDFSDGVNTITLGSNPDAATSDSDVDAPGGAENGQLFTVVDCSTSVITPIRSGATINAGTANYVRGSSLTITNTNQQADIFSATSQLPGRIDIDNCKLKVRIPAYVKAGNYTAILTQTFV